MPLINGIDEIIAQYEGGSVEITPHKMCCPIDQYGYVLLLLEGGNINFLCT